MSFQLEHRIANLERILRNIARPGVVAERDHEKGVRFEIGKDDDGNPVLSSWMQPPDLNKGKRSRVLPDVGSQALIFTPPGFETSTSFLPMSHHDNSQNPAANADESVFFDDGQCRLSVADGVLTLKSGSSVVTIGGSEISITSSTIQNNGTSLKHNAKEIGDNHTHTGVTAGLADTGNPT